MGTTIDRLDIEIQSRASSASNNIDRLIKNLNSLKNVTSDGGQRLSKISDSMLKLREASKGISSTGSKNIDKLTQSLQALNSVSMYGVNEKLTSVSKTVGNIKSLGDSLTSAKDFSKAVTNLKSAAKRLNDIDMDNLAKNVSSLTSALRPLTDEMLRAAPVASSYALAINEVTKSAKSMNYVAQSKATKNMSDLFSFAKYSGFVYILQRIATLISSSILSINSYIENVNLFSVALGDATQKATEFTSRMQELLGINAGEAMRNMGLFQNLVTSFGVASDQAYILSKNLTQLGYDYSSFFNITVDDAFQKLQSGLAGEIEPLILAA